jgi:NADH-quinone oxidoreductase subunit N
LSVRTVVAASGAFVFLFWLWPAPLVKAAGAAAKSLF